jgi:arsenate reductase
LLNENGIQPTVVLYLDTPPSVAEIESLLAQLGFTDPRQLMRTKEDGYAELGLNDPTTSRGALLSAMANHPKLIERPIVVHDGRAALGRPPENVLALLG